MLSRAPLDGVTDSDQTLQEDADAFVNLTVQSLPATEHRLEDIRQHQQQDEECHYLSTIARQDGQIRGSCLTK